MKKKQKKIKVSVSGIDQNENRVTEELSVLAEPPVTQTAYGFLWGDMSVQRVATFNGNQVIAISTPYETRYIRVTPKGRVRFS